MALLFMDGFDVGDYAVKGWASVASSGNTPTYSLVAGRVGGNALNMANTAAVGSGYVEQMRPIPATTQLTMGVAVKLTTDFGLSGGFLISLFGDAGAAQHLTLVSDATTKEVVLRLGSQTGTVIATSGKVMTLNVWAYFEIQATIADAGGTCVVRMNGSTTPIINYSGDTKNGGTGTSITYVACGAYRAGLVVSNEAAAFDDLYILDGTGGSHNTFLGDVRIASLQPDGAGIDTQLTPTGSATNWQNVDETPYSTTDYNGSAIVGQRDTYALADLPGTITTVHALQSNIVAAKSDATTASAKIPIRTGGTLYYGQTTALSTSYLTYSDVHQINPNTSIAWTPANVNGLEAGMEVA